MLKPRFIVPAMADLDAALTASDVPNELERETDRVLTDLCSELIAGFSVHGTPCRKWLLKRFPYSIVYRIDGDVLRVVAFAHHKRKTAYWLRRLKQY